jgi:3-phenylpropionate/trans-cinnamate dioxygenase ferredoxin reductase subunit
MNRTIIVGGGQAGIQLADSLRAEGYDGAIDVYADEPHMPYQRPPLSKDFMSDVDGGEALPLKTSKFFSDHAVTFHPNTRVTAVDRANRTVSASDGSVQTYSALVFATGARNRELTVEGSDLAGVHYLRTLDEARALQSDLAKAQRVVVIGAGFIGLEFAAAALQRGVDVTVLEFASRPMARVLSQSMSNYFTESHAQSGIDLQLGEGVSSLSGADGRVTGAIGTSGAEFPADLVVVGVGVVPNAELAESAGLETANGIVVDSYLQTQDPHIFAVGDCCSYPNVYTGGLLRLESVQNATDQARTLAKTLTGNPTPYKSLPWFWSQQGKIKLQIAGIVGRDDDVILRGDPASGKFSVYCFYAGRLTGVESVNSPSEHMAARRILELGVPLSPDEVSDESFDPKAHSRRPVESVPV